MKAKVSEVFNSIQGEGIYVGKRQLFIRFYGCNLSRCQFCDTVLHTFKEYECDDLLNYLRSFPGNFHSISLTGGEPLLQKDFLREFLPAIKKQGHRVYLETNATLPVDLSEVIDYIDIMAMDFKLPSSTGLNDFWQEHEEFLKVSSAKECSVKAVICNSTEFTDIKKAVQLLYNFNKSIPFILQPNTYELDRLLMQRIQEFKLYSLEFLSDVRVIPQMHRLVGVK